MTSSAALVEVTRRDQRSGRELVESVHVGTVVVVDGTGEIVAATGDAKRVTYVRSAVKPFQAAACLQLLGDEADDLTDDEVAVAWASHRAEPRHLDAVTRLLERSGTPADELTCPAATGEDDPAARPERIRFNCSGKHAMFALAGSRLGEQGATLIDPDSRLQQHVLQAMEDWLAPADAIAVDGCGAPAVAVPLVALARGYIRLLRDPPFERVAQAGFAHPGLVGGRDRAETALLDAGVIAKPGAEGVFGVAFRTAAGRDLAAAVKIDDGAGRAAAVAAVAVVAAFGGPVVDWQHPPPTGGGQPQGQVRATSLFDELARHGVGSA